MKLAGAAALAAAGLWAGLAAAGELRKQTAECDSLCRMLELMAFELERFRTPLPALLASLSEQLEGAGGKLCGDTARRMDTASFREAWSASLEELPSREREILRPLGEILGRYGGEEQCAAVERARSRMCALREERSCRAEERGRVWIGVMSAAGLMLAVLLI